MANIGAYLLVAVLFLTYLLLVSNRKAFQYVIPFVLEEKWITKTDIGFIISCQTVGYTFSKFCGGLAADHVNNRIMLSASVFISGIIIQLFVFSHNVLLSAFLYFCLGIVHGVTWPAIAKILRQVMPPDEFGISWVIVSCSMNIASMVCPIVSAYVAKAQHWTYSIEYISLVTLGFSFVVMFFLLGPYGGKSNSGRANVNAGDEVDISWSDILTNPLQLVLCFNFFTTSIIRFTATDWMPLYFIQAMNFSKIFGGSFISILELGGIIGSLVVAKISDMCIKKMSFIENPRLPALISCSVIALTCLMIISTLRTLSQTVVSILAFILGFSIYGPVSLIGVAVMESAPNKVSATCHTFAALAANLGATAAAYPISVLSNHLGWRSTFLVIFTLHFSAMITMVACLRAVPLKRKLKSD